VNCGDIESGVGVSKLPARKDADIITWRVPDSMEGKTQKYPKVVSIYKGSTVSVVQSLDF
jgi:hypothetical protein